MECQRGSPPLASSIVWLEETGHGSTSTRSRRASLFPALEVLRHRDRAAPGGEARYDATVPNGLGTEEEGEEEPGPPASCSRRSRSAPRS